MKFKSSTAALLFSGALAAGLLGCALGDELESHTAALGECDETSWGCSSNSPEIDHYGFHELNLNGMPNTSNVAITSIGGVSQIVRNGISYDLAVKESRILGMKKGQVALSGQALVGAEIRLVLGGQPDYVIRIEGVRDIVFPYGAQDRLEAYALSWYGPGVLPDSKRNVCKAVNTATQSSKTTFAAYRPPVDLEFFGLGKLESVVFEGDRIDAASKTTSDVFDDRWFNIGCAGHTLAKMHLMRHTLAAAAPQYGVDQRDRQATLKLLSGDYCGRGRPYTEAGVPLVWQGDLVSYRTTPRVLEARWTEKGATCLDLPRLYARYPDIATRIAQECNLAPCSSSDPFAFDGALRVSSLVQ